MRTAVSRSLDLLVVALLGATVGAVVVAGRPSGAWLLAPVAALLTFLPGYAVVSALWPRADDARPATRAGLGFALSVALVPMVAFALDPFVGFRPVLVAGVAAAVTVVASVAALVRRARVDDAPDTLGWLALSARRYFTRSSSLRGAVPLGARTGRDVALNALIVASVLVLVASVGVAALVPQSHGYTEAYLTDGGGANAPLVSNGGSDVSADTLESLHVAVENHEGRDVSYRTVVVAQDVTRESGDVHVQAERVLSRSSHDVPDGETWSHAVSTGGGGADRLVVRVYAGDATRPTARLTLQR